ncbi:glycosyltransferase family 4 protein [Halomicrobium katesii]|uniref:glycosyltransferase family 4 protein n=1 Tax=Halomicrobium katesii TaxID=437163 RepID=UPI0005D192CD|nr:glycosyltransferase family 4 protein [Halomicrobium katesii]
MTSSKSTNSIFYITQYYPPETGAPATRVNELTRRWADAEHDITVITSAPDYPEGELFEGYDNSWVQTESRDGVDIVMMKTIPASNAETLRRILKFVWFMLAATCAGIWVDDSPDAVIATSPQPLIGVSALAVGRLRGAAVIFEVRDLWPETIQSVGDFDNGIALWGIEKTVNFVYRTADRVVTVSREFNETLTEAGVDSDRLWYHPNGVDTEFFETNSATDSLDDEVRAAFDAEFVISYVGTIGRTHGLEVVLDAADRLVDDERIRFVLVGYGSEMDRLQQQAKRRGLDNVVFTGRRPKEDVPKVQALSDASLVHLKDRELFRTVIPSKMFESMAASLPIVLGVEGEAARIVTEAGAGLPISPGDPGELVEATRLLADDPEAREQFGKNGYSFVKREFSWDTIAREYRENIEQVAT